MSRQVRNEVGLNIVCDLHPNIVLFLPRLSLDPAGSPFIREAGRRETVRGIVYPTGERKYSRRCPRRGCPIHLEYEGWRVRIVVRMLAECHQRAILTVTGREMEKFVTDAEHWQRALSTLDTDPSASP